MKILLVHIYFTKKYSSGVNPILFGIYETLKKTGNEAYIYALDLKPYYQNDYKYSKYFPKSNSVLFETENRKSVLRYYLNCLYNNEAKIKLERMIEDIKPDIVHIHTIGELSYSVLEPVRKANIPVIYTEHDITKYCPGAFHVGTNYCNKCSGYKTFFCAVKKCIKQSVIKSLYVSIKTFIHRICGSQRGELFIAVSQALKNYMINVGINQNKIVVLPNYIDKNTVEKVKLDCLNYSGFFLYAGGNHKIKGIYTLIEAIKSLPQDIEFHIAGSDNYDDINKVINEFKLNVKVLGLLTKEQLEEEYKNCIAVIMPSECFESFGMINIEAAIYEKPSISSDIGGLSEVVEDGKTGLLFTPKNVQQLRDCILKYWNNRDLAIEHGKAAREKTLKNYNEDIYFEKLMNIYKEVLKTKEKNESRKNI